MSQNDSDATNIPRSSKEVDLSPRMIFTMDHLIQQQDCLVRQQERIISLIEAIAPKKKTTKMPENYSDGTNNSSSAEERLSEHERKRRLKLYGAAQTGDWKMAKRIYDDHREDFGVEISRNKDTVLHIAAGAKRIDFVKELVRKMNEEDLENKNESEQTALFPAAMSGKVEIAKEIITKNKGVAMVADKFGTLPIQTAAALGHKDMVKYLYQQTKGFLKEEDRKDLFVRSIEIDLFDVALQLFEYYPDLATARANNGETALHALARKDLGAKYVEKKTLQQARELVELIWGKVILLSHTEISELIAKPRKVMFDAAKRGNSMFLYILIRDYPDLMWKVDNPKSNYNIFHYAVKYRQQAVFKLLHEIGSSTEIFVRAVDKRGNNILHLAGMLAPSDRLNIVPGAALQMRRELLWFKEVQKIVQPSSAEAGNKNGLTPTEVFTKEHENLREKGEQWMRDTANSCMVVAALIATVAFAAVFTVPGGNNGDTGFPIFLGKLSFLIFAISDAISLVSSSASILNFLSILTSLYTEEDFLYFLPRKLYFGLITLFISIATMMIMFSTTFFIIFSDRRLWLAILVTIFASTPVIMFMWKYFQLFNEVLCSICASDSLFNKGESSLFREEKEASDQRKKSEMFQTKCCTNV